jgi:hypothetical protein
MRTHFKPGPPGNRVVFVLLYASFFDTEKTHWHWPRQLTRPADPCHCVLCGQIVKSATNSNNALELPNANLILIWGGGIQHCAVWLQLKLKLKLLSVNQHGDVRIQIKVGASPQAQCNCVIPTNSITRLLVVMTTPSLSIVLLKSRSLMSTGIQLAK